MLLLIWGNSILQFLFKIVYLDLLLVCVFLFSTKMVPVYYEDRPRRSKLFVAAATLLWIALILLIVGFVTPGWLFLDFDFLPGERVMHTGLWYAVVCISGSCETGSLVDNGGMK